MPSLGMITINAFACADSVLIPVQAAYLPVKGLEQLIKTIGKVKRQLNPGLKIEGILLTMVDIRTNYAKDISAMLKDTYGDKVRIFTNNIPLSVRAAEISAEGISIYKHDPKGIIYTGYAEDEEPVLNYYELVSLYRVYSDDIYFNCADTAANIDCLKTIFNDMCSYQTKIVTEEYENTDGEIVSETVLIVDVTIHDVMELAEKYQFTEIQMEGLEFFLSPYQTDEQK